jgi:tRNA-splicing ligase RtcB (3'-phosphate/5'-hydroxy nucleic acid ligase)
MQIIETSGVQIKAWVDGVPFEDAARAQVERVATLPFVHDHVAIMPDVHWGIGATVGSVIATRGAVIPAAVGVDIGCGMVAVRTNLSANDLPDSLGGVRSAIEAAVPHGRTDNGGANDRGSWGFPPQVVCDAWNRLEPGLARISEKHEKVAFARHAHQLGTMGGGNHFCEVCLDENDAVWLMLHSGSRGVGNRIGTYFIQLAREDMREHIANLPDRDLAYLEEGTEHFADYVEAVSWAQEYARTNRELMLSNALGALAKSLGRPILTTEAAVNCHHNYVSREHHFGADVLVTRKGAVSAREGELGIIPGSMGAKSFIVRGKGNPDSFCSCAHGAGRKMSRGEAKRSFTVADHVEATQGIECRKDASVIDETPAAYKSIDAVMAAQSDLVEVVHTLRQVVCVKG